MSYRTSDTAEEALQAAYIKQHGERMSETVVLTWMDDGRLDSDDHADLRRALQTTLETFLTGLELAELASRCVGGPDFEAFCEEQS